MRGVAAVGGRKYRRLAVLSIACLLSAAVATGAERRAPQKQLLRHPTLATEFALPLGGSRLLLGGRLQDGQSALIVLRRDGSLDPHFASHGVRRFAEDAGPYFAPEEFGSQVAVDRKGRILYAAGGSVRRLLPNGRLDRSFGSRGAARIRFGEQRTELISVAVQPDGRIVVGGGSEISEDTTRPALARLTERGDPDPSFGEKGGKILRSHGGDKPRVVDVAVGLNGGVFAVVGYFSTGLAIRRVGPKGGIDRSFGRGGVLIVGEDGPGESGLFAVPNIAVTLSGKLVVGSSTPIHGGREDALVALRYLADGRPDPSFGRNGRVVLATGVNASTGAVAVRPGGGIVLSGDGIGKRSRYFLLAALRPDGDRDSTVGPGGFAKARFSGTYSYATALVLQGKTAIAIGHATQGHSEVNRTLLARFPLSR